jgi:hypothetical protein
VKTPSSPLVDITARPSFFENCARKEPAYRMRLPAGSFHQFLGSCPFRSFEQLENLGRLAAITGGASSFGAFRCFLGWGSLFPALAFFGATVRARLATLAFWVALGASAAGARAVSSAFLPSRS